MAFQYKFSASFASDAKSILITNTTGEYPAVSTGFGNPTNLTVDAVTACDLIITIPDPVTHLPSTTTITIDLFAKGFPVANAVSVTNEDLGLDADARIPDGAYAIEGTIGYTFTDGGGSEVVGTSTAPQATALNIYSAQCCIAGVVPAKLMGCKCGKLSKTSINILFAYALLWAIPNAVTICDPPKTEEAANMLARVKEICNEINNCKNCGC